LSGYSIQSFIDHHILEEGMARKKRHSAAEIAAKLDEADTLSAQGRNQSEIAKALGISVMTFHRWRKERATASRSKTAIGVTSADSAEPAHSSRISELQLENSRLRRLVTDLLLEKMRLEDEQQRRNGRAARA
jgi:putative transposase